MLPDQYRWIVDEFEPEGDAAVVFEIGKRLETDGNLEGAATAYDRAFGLDPRNGDVRQARARVLDALAVVEHGLRFRYVPGGSFLMGSLDGDADERPYHPVWLSPYWVSETPLSWANEIRLTGRTLENVWDGSEDSSALKLRFSYSADDPENHAEPRFDTKPMVAVAWDRAVGLAERLSSSRVHYALPTEAQWERAARGGRIGSRYAWGDAAPTAKTCDCDRFFQLSILPMTSLPPNDYGLYAMNGGVWEWTRDWYDRDYYSESVLHDPQGPPHGKERVLRGGSWADCTAVVTNTFRMSLATPTEQADLWEDLTPTIGFRLIRELKRTP